MLAKNRNRQGAHWTAPSEKTKIVPSVDWNNNTITIQMASLFDSWKRREHTMMHQKRKRSWEAGSRANFELKRSNPMEPRPDHSKLDLKDMKHHPSNCSVQICLSKERRNYAVGSRKPLDSFSWSCISTPLKITWILVLVCSQRAAPADAYTINRLRKLIYYIPEQLITIFGPDYERNVSPSPVSSPTLPPTKAPVQWVNAPDPAPTKAPVAPTTKSPTRVPTLNPTRKPTKIPTSVPTKNPTMQPLPSPTKRPTPSPTLSPTLPPTPRPTTLPSDTPSAPPSSNPEAELPTNEPTEVPQDESIDSNPTEAPSIANSTTPAPQVDPLLPKEPDVTKAPAPRIPSLSPSKAPKMKETLPPSQSPESNIFDRSPTPQPAVAPETQFVDVSVPIDFEVDAILQNGNQTLDRISDIWAESIQNYYQDVYSGQSDVQVQNTKLQTAPKSNSQRTRQLRLRTLQEGDTVRIRSTGESNFKVDEISRDPWDFSSEAGQQLNSYLTTENLQQALRDSNYDGAVLVSEVQSNVTPEDSNAREPPTNAEIVIGFTLLVLTLASLAFWANVLWEKRQKKLRARRLEAARKANSIPFPPPPQRAHRSMARGESAKPMMGIKHTISSDSSLSSYRGLESQSDVGRDNGNSELGEPLDPFAEELKRAVSLDRAAWDEFLRKKQLMEDEQRAFAAATTSSYSINSTAVSVGQTDRSKLAVFDAPGSQDMGMEVAMNTSFPYGDERHNTSKIPMHLTSDNAVELSDAGISRGIKSNEINKIPNNAGRTEKSLMESWDLNENPVKDENGPSQFSFLYPLKRRNLSDEVPDGRLSSDNDSDDSPSSAAVRGSPEVTSIDSATNESYSQSNSLKDVRRYEEELDEIDDEAESRITASMLKEVENITKYLQLYEQTKKESRLTKQQQLIERSRQLSTSLESQTSASVPYEAFQSMATSRDIEKSQFSVPQTASISSDRSHDEEGDHEDDEGSRRLGISRYVVEKPTAPLLWYRDDHPFDDEDNDNSATSPSRSVLVEGDSYPLSPIPYSDSFRQEPPSVAEDEEIASPSRPEMADVTTTTQQTSEPEPSSATKAPRSLPPPSTSTPQSSPKNNKTRGFLSSLRKSQSVFDDSAPFDEKKSIKTRARPTVLQSSSTTKEPIISPRVKKTSKTFQSLFSMFESKPMKPIVPPNDTWQYGGTGRNKEKKRFKYFGFPSDS